MYYENGSPTKYTSTDGKTVLESADDVAAKVMGGNWIMPTQSQLSELIDETKTTNEWVTKYNDITGLNGMTFTGKGDYSDNAIFIPAAGLRNSDSLFSVGSSGYVWSSSLDTDSPNKAVWLKFGSNSTSVSAGNRCNGYSVRGVIPK